MAPISSGLWPMQAAMGAMAPDVGQSGGGGQQPQPRSEGEAVKSANARNQTQVGKG